MFYLKRIFSIVLKLRNFLRIAFFRLNGIDVSWSANIHKSVEMDTGGGRIIIGERTIIDKDVIIRAYGGSIHFGNDCSVNPYSVIYGHGGLFIGNGVRIAAHAVFIPADHIFKNSYKFIYQQGETMLGIQVEDDVWFGAGVRVLDGVKIGKGAVIGAGAVISKSVDAYGIYAGVPARKIGQRN